MLFVHSPEEAQRAKCRDFLIHFILFLFLFSFLKVPTLSWILLHFFWFWKFLKCLKTASGTFSLPMAHTCFTSSIYNLGE